MRASHINPFIKSVQLVFETMLDTRVTTAKPYVKEDDRATNDVTGIIALSGEAVGSVAVSFPMETAKKSVEAFTGMPVEEVDDDFSDAIDFVGWYTHNTNKTVHISKWDPYNQYLAYHEGATGWKRGTYKSKGWLKDTARRVDYRAREWGAQLKRCEHDLEKGWWIFG